MLDSGGCYAAYVLDDGLARALYCADNRRVMMPDTITLSLPRYTSLPVVVGKWRRGRSKRIVASYTLEELAWALCCTDSWRVGLERLEELSNETI